jgi:HTH-type transcriptional regulator/antitoxin HigA
MVRNTIGLSRDFIIHPGETLKEVLENRELSQRELALRTGVTETHISWLVNGKKGISISFAKKLEYVLNVDASFWINLQSNYDKELEDYKEINDISDREVRVLSKLENIISFMQQNGIIPVESSDLSRVIDLRKLLNISSLFRIPDICQAGAYRLPASANIDPYVLFTWLRLCDLITSKYKISKVLDVEKLKKAIPLIKEVMFADVSKIQLRLQDIFAQCGIRFSIIKYFTGAPVQGVLKKGNDGSLSLIVTDRQKFADIFWFTLFHEIGHVIHGDFEDQLIDYESVDSDVEKRADEYATNALIRPDEYQRFVESENYSLDHINYFCSEVGVPNYVLIGRLQKEGFLRYNQYVSEKARYEIEDLINV